MTEDTHPEPDDDRPLPAAADSRLSRIHAATGLAKSTEPVITMGVVQRYIEAEQQRNRRALVWFGTTFLFLMVGVVVAFLVLGYILLNRSNETMSAVESYADKMVEVDDKVGTLEQSTDALGKVVQAREAKVAREREALKVDLKRFSDWVATKMASGTNAAAMQSADVAMISSLQDRFREMEEANAEREKELATLQELYAKLSAIPVVTQTVVATVTAAPLPEVAAPVTPVPAATAVADASREPVTPIPQPAATAAVAVVETPEPAVVSDAEQAVPGPIDENEFIPDRPTGEVMLMTFPNGDKYEGEFRGGLFHGYGTLYSRNGDKYEGSFRDDVKNGRGVMTYANGDRYAGDFKEDLKEGRGVFTFVNGDKYSGDFTADMMTGKGTLIYANGNRYAGDFRNGLKWGQGEFRYANGDVYKGQFKADLREGVGTYTYVNGEQYIGDFRNGRREGKGRYVYAGGEEFIGEFRDGKKSGPGVCVYPDGERLEGIWRDDVFVNESTTPPAAP